MSYEFDESVIRRAFRRLMERQNDNTADEDVGIEDTCDRLLEICRQERNRGMSLMNMPEYNFSQFLVSHYANEYDGIGNRNGKSACEFAEKARNTCFMYATTFASKAAPGNIFLTGTPGTGKTFLASCMAHHIVNNGFFGFCRAACNAQDHHEGKNKGNQFFHSSFLHIKTAFMALI